jgi:predicted nucleotidyltransferase
VYESIARSVVSGDYGPLSDDDLTVIAAQTFSLLDEEESRAEHAEYAERSPLRNEFDMPSASVGESHCGTNGYYRKTR